MNVRSAGPGARNSPGWTHAEHQGIGRFARHRQVVLPPRLRVLVRQVGAGAELHRPAFVDVHEGAHPVVILLAETGSEAIQRREETEPEELAISAEYAHHLAARAGCRREDAHGIIVALDPLPGAGQAELARGVGEGAQPPDRHAGHLDNGRTGVAVGDFLAHRGQDRHDRRQPLRQARRQLHRDVRPGQRRTQRLGQRLVANLHPAGTVAGEPAVDGETHQQRDEARGVDLLDPADLAALVDQTGFEAGPDAETAVQAVPPPDVGVEREAAPATLPGVTRALRQPPELFDFELDHVGSLKEAWSG